jgi:hypothetical protein
MTDALPPELVTRCAAIQDGDAQGLPLERRDYVAFAVATVVVPAILLIIGVLL